MIFPESKSGEDFESYLARQAASTYGRKDLLYYLPDGINVRFDEERWAREYLTCLKKRIKKYEEREGIPYKVAVGWGSRGPA